MNTNEKIMTLVASEKVSNYRINKATGVNIATLSRLKNGKANPSNLTSETAEKLINYYGEVFEDGK